jgi:hypothetical protein
MRTYKQWSISNKDKNGLYHATNIIDGYLETLRADTLNGLKQLINRRIKNGSEC